MIIYNMRYRGPFEYEKMLLNAFQLHNETQRLLGILDNKNLKELKEKAAELDRVLDESSGEECMLQDLLLTRMRLLEQAGEEI